MLMSPQWSECKESRIVLGETPACAEVFDRFLQYFYTGHICVDAQTVMPILTLADKYNLKVRELSRWLSLKKSICRDILVCGICMSRI